MRDTEENAARKIVRAFVLFCIRTPARRATTAIVGLALVTYGLGLWGCANTPHPVNPDNGVFIKCPSGGYCDRNSEVCGEVGKSCGPNDCCFIGDDGRAFASKRGQRREAAGFTDAGAEGG